MGALDRVVRRSGGALSRDLSRVLADVRTGEPVSLAFDRMAAGSGLPLVARFAQGIAIAVERGTPLADVLHAQAADVREAGRRQLIETAARREVLMMVPVVFLVLPITVLFAFWPGVVGPPLDQSLIVTLTPRKNGRHHDHFSLLTTRRICAVRGGRRDERGDVPGWVLITVMTAGLVMVIWGVARNELTAMLGDALNSVHR